LASTRGLASSTFSTVHDPKKQLKVSERCLQSP
jgi:hypothetical protein